MDFELNVVGPKSTLCVKKDGGLIRCGLLGYAGILYDMADGTEACRMRDFIAGWCVAQWGRTMVRSQNLETIMHWVGQ